MIELLNDQAESDRAFRRWVEALTRSSTSHSNGWTIDGTGLSFSNYGSAEPGSIKNEVMLGVDLGTGDGTVKIVKPRVSQRDKGKLTVIGRNREGHFLLLREGWLHANNVSGAIRADFGKLSGLKPVPVRAAGARSERSWFVVARLQGSRRQIVFQTVEFAMACIRARSIAGNTTKTAPEPKPYSYGRDEKGRLILVKRRGGTSEVRALQGFVCEALRKRVGPSLTKPARNGYAVDGMIQAANMLVEIKTGAFARHCYEAVGQLSLYPALIGLDHALKRILLLPDTPPLRPAMALALRNASIEVFTYGVSGLNQKPVITFSRAFLDALGSVSSRKNSKQTAADARSITTKEPRR